MAVEAPVEIRRMQEECEHLKKLCRANGLRALGTAEALRSRLAGAGVENGFEPGTVTPLRPRVTVVTPTTAPQPWAADEGFVHETLPSCTLHLGAADEGVTTPQIDSLLPSVTPRGMEQLSAVRKDILLQALARQLQIPPLEPVVDLLEDPPQLVYLAVPQARGGSWGAN